jgi:two-component system, OmpR family, KDP operon response regulator KdpE
MSEPPVPGAKVLIVEDDAHIRRFVKLALQSESHEVCEAETVARALIEAATRRPELVVLDLGLPDADGCDFIREFRSWSSAPVIVLSARTTEADKVTALDAGADDYLVKPFGVPELLARTRAQLRRRLQHTRGEDAQFVFGDTVLDRARRSVQRAGQELHLTPIEYKLLLLLSAQPDRVLTHRHLLNEVWGPGHTEDVHYVRVHMANLRKKLEPDPSRPRWLLTEAGVGSRFKTEAPHRPEGAPA